jgi:hypothetical protein
MLPLESVLAGSVRKLDDVNGDGTFGSALEFAAGSAAFVLALGESMAMDEATPSWAV